LRQYSKGEPFTIGNTLFSPEGIIIKRSLLKSHFIKWDKVRTKSYATYLAIYSADDPGGINGASNYLEDWNTSVLYSALRGILQVKKIEVYD